MNNIFDANLLVHDEENTPYMMLYPKIPKQTKAYVVYALSEPATIQAGLDGRSVRYIGYTENLKERFMHHVTNAYKLKSEKDCWIWSLRMKRNLPDAIIMEEYDDRHTAMVREAWYHQEFLSGLVNCETRRLKNGYGRRYFGFDRIELITEDGKSHFFENGIAYRFH